MILPSWELQRPDLIRVSEALRVPSGKCWLHLARSPFEHMFAALMLPSITHSTLFSSLPFLFLFLFSFPFPFPFPFHFPFPFSFSSSSSSSLLFPSLPFSSLLFPSLPFSSLLFPSLPFSSLLFSSLLLSSLLFSSPLFSSLLFSSLLFFDSYHLCFSSVHIVRSLTSKLPSIITYLHKYPAGPETVLVKARFSKNEYGTVAKRVFFSWKTSKKWMPKFGCFAFYHSNSSFSSEGFCGVWKIALFRQKMRFNASIVFCCKLALRFMYLHCQDFASQELTT